MNFGTVAILGPGLIGGSLALALAERGLAKRPHDLRPAPLAPSMKSASPKSTPNSPATPAKPSAKPMSSSYACPSKPWPASFTNSATPSNPAPSSPMSAASRPASSATSSPLLEGRALWIGSHPMAGSERGGFSAARPDLFDAAMVILTPTRHTHRDAERRAGQFWTALGANLAVLSPEKHDQIVAAVSHIPHLLAAALVNHAVKHGDLDLAAGGFRDTTRVASGSPELWVEILLANRDAICTQIQSLIRDLQELERVLQPLPPVVPGVPPDEKKPLATTPGATSDWNWAAKSALLTMLKAAHDARSQISASRSKRK